jgi:hypothetical protein
MTATRTARLLIGAAALVVALAAPAAVAAAEAPRAASHGLGLLPTAGLRTGVTAAGAALVQDAAPLPAAVDLSQWDPPVGNQGSPNACASWAAGYYYRYWLRNHASGETATYAPMFLYSQLTHGTDVGSSIGDNVALLQSMGIPHAADYPQGFLDFATQPTSGEVQAALPYRVASGSFLMFDTGVGTEAQTAIEASLAAGRPVILSFPLYQAFISAGPASYFVDAPAPGEWPSGYHGAFVPKYDAQGVWVENSWGTRWGKSGWAELSWAFVNQYAVEGWTMAADEGISLGVSAFASPLVAGVAQTLTVAAKNPDGSRAAGYGGTVHFASSDPAAVLPADYTFTSADAGTQAFSVTLTTAGTESITVTDTADGSISGTQSGVIAAAPVAAPTGGTYHAIPPARVLDSRASYTGVTNMGLIGKFVAGTVRTFAVADARYVGGGSSPAVPVGANAVTGNITMVNATAAGVVALGPAEASDTEVTTITFAPGDTRATGVTVGLGPGGTLQAVFRSATVGASVDLIFDATGYFTVDTTGTTYHAVPPGRVLDSRPSTSGTTNIGLSGKFQNRVVRTFGIVGVRALGWTGALVPGGATAVTGNLTVTNATSPGYVALGPSMTTTPSTSTLNVIAGTNRANAVTVALRNGRLAAVWCGTLRSTADVIFDVTGYFTADMTGLSYHPIDPTRLLDSSTNRGLAGPFATGSARTLTIGGTDLIPADAAGISGQITIVGPSSTGWALVSPDAVAAPRSSSLNTNPGVSCANGLNVPLASGHVALVWTGQWGSSANLQLDVTGYWK